MPYPVRGGIRFELRHNQKEPIELIGSWDGWSRKKHYLSRIMDYHWIELDLPPGRYEYVFILMNGKRYLPPNARRRVPDGFGGYNGIVTVAGKAGKP